MSSSPAASTTLLAKPSLRNRFTGLQWKYRTSLSFNFTKTSLSIHLNYSSMLTHEILNDFISEITKKLQMTSHITSLTLTFQGMTELGLKSFKKISPLIKSAKHLEKFAIVLPYWTYYVPEYLQIIRKSLQFSRNLKHFELTIFNLGFNIHRISTLSNFLSKIHKIAPKVTTFKFTYTNKENFSTQEIVSTNFLAKLAKGIKHIKTLVLNLALIFFLSLKFGRIDTLDFSPLKNLRSLQDLTIHLFNTSSYLKVSENNYSINPHHYFPNLKTLKMSLFDSFYSPTKAVLAITSKFAVELPKLKAVSIVIAYQHSLTDEELADLSSRLGNGIKNLKQISLTFCEISLNNAALKHIMSIPLNPKFKTLETLSLNFWQCQFLSNKFITKLGENICQNLVSLKRLYLNLVPIPASYPILGGLRAFLDIEGISNKGLVQFGKVLERRGMSNLEMLSLNIDQSPQISDVGVKKFCDNIEGIKGLEKVFLKFRLCHKVTWKAKEYMEERFGNNAKKGKLELI